MNILYVSDSTTVSGAEIVMLGYLDGLASRGHTAYGYMSSRNPRLMAAFRERGVPFTATSKYSPYLIQTTANPAALLSYGRSFHRVAREMTEIIRSARIDLIHSISYPASLYAAFASARSGVKQIWHEHNIKRLHPVNRLIYRHVANTSRWVIGPSDAVTLNLARAGIDPARLRTVYNGIDLRRFQHLEPDQITSLRRELGVGPGEQAIGLFGQMLPKKGHRTLIEAAPRILQDHPRSRFFIVGALENPSYQDELRDLIASLGLQQRFHFTGWRNDVQDIIRTMDVVVVATTTPEPASLMLMEASAMERAIVASRTGGTAELIEEDRTGLLFDPGDSVQLAERIGRLLADPGMATRLGAAGRRRVEDNYSLERHLATMFDLYENSQRDQTTRPS